MAAELKLTKEGLRYIIRIKDRAKDKEEKVRIPTPGVLTHKLSSEEVKQAYEKIYIAFKSNPTTENRRQLELMWFLLEQDKIKTAVDKRTKQAMKAAGSVWHKIGKVFSVVMNTGADHVERTMGALDNYWGKLLLEPEKGLAIAGTKANYNALLDSWITAKDFKYKDSKTFTDPFKSYPARFTVSLLSTKTFAEYERLGKIYTVKQRRFEPYAAFKIRKQAMKSWYDNIIMVKTLRFAHKLANSEYGKTWADKNKDTIEFQYRFWNDPLWFVGISKVKLVKNIPFARQAFKAIDPSVWIQGAKYLKLAKISNKFPAIADRANKVLNLKPIKKIVKFFTGMKPVEARIQQLPEGNKLMGRLSELLVLNRGNMLTQKKTIQKLMKGASGKELNQVMEVLSGNFKKGLKLIDIKTGKIIAKDYDRVVAHYGKKVAYYAVKGRNITQKGWKPGTPFRSAYWPSKGLGEGREIIGGFKKPPTGWRKPQIGKYHPKEDTIATLANIANREDRHKINKIIFKHVNRFGDNIKKGKITPPGDPADTLKDLQTLKDWVVNPRGFDITGTPFAKIPREKIVEKIVKGEKKVIKKVPIKKMVTKRVRVTEPLVKKVKKYKSVKEFTSKTHAIDRLVDARVYQDYGSPIEEVISDIKKSNLFSKKELNVLGREVKSFKAKFAELDQLRLDQQMGDFTSRDELLIAIKQLTEKITDRVLAAAPPKTKLIAQVAKVTPPKQVFKKVTVPTKVTKGVVEKVPVTETVKTIQKITGVKKLGYGALRANDMIIGLQKKVQLAYNPAWYFKNFVDTVLIKNMLADVPLNKLFSKKVYKGYKGQTVDFAGVMARELMDLIEKGKLSRGLGRFGNLIENLGRNVLGQHFLEATYKANLKKGIVPKEAWKLAVKFSWDKVRHVHFNYNELSAFDNVMKRVFPYWVYHTRNLTFFTKEFLHRPAAIKKMNDIRDIAYKQIKEQAYSKLKAPRLEINIGRFRFRPTQWLSFSKIGEVTDPEKLAQIFAKDTSKISQGFEILGTLGITPATLLEMTLSKTPLMENKDYKSILPQLGALDAIISGLRGKPTSLKDYALENVDALIPTGMEKEWQVLRKFFKPGKEGTNECLIKIEMTKQKQRKETPNRKKAERKVANDLTFMGLTGFFFGIYGRSNDEWDIKYRKVKEEFFKASKGEYLPIEPTKEDIEITKKTFPDLNEAEVLFMITNALRQKVDLTDKQKEDQQKILEENPWLPDRWDATKPEEELKVKKTLDKTREDYEAMNKASKTLGAKFLETKEGKFLEKMWGTAGPPEVAIKKTAMENFIDFLNERKETGNPLTWSEVPKDIQEQFSTKPNLKIYEEVLKHNERYQKASSPKYTKEKIEEWENEKKELEIKKEKLSPTFASGIEREIKELTRKQLRRKWDFEKYDKLPKYDKDKLIEENETWKSGYEGYQAHKLMYETVEEKGKKPKEVARPLRWEKLTADQKALVKKAYEGVWDVEQTYYKAKIRQIIKDKEGKSHYDRYNLLTGKLKEVADREYPYIRKSYFDIKIQKAIRNPVTGKIDFDKYEKLPPEARAAAIKRVPKIEEWYKRHKEAKQAKKQHDWYVAWKQFGFKEIRLKRLAKENPALYKRLKLSIPEVEDIPIRTATSRIMKYQKENKYSGSSLAIALNSEPEQAEKIFKKYEYMEKLVKYDKKTKKWVTKKQPKRVYGVRRRIEVGPPKEIARQAALISSVEKSWSYGIAKAARAGESAARSAAYGGNKALESFERKRKARLIPSLPEEKKVYIPKPLKISPIEKATKERIRRSRRSERLIKLLGPSGFSRSRYGRAKAILDK